MKYSNNKDLSNIDSYTKLTFLEDLIFNKLSNKNSINSSFNNNLKILLEVIKLKHKLKPQNEELNFLNFFESETLNNNESIKNIDNYETPKIK